MPVTSAPSPAPVQRLHGFVEEIGRLLLECEAPEAFFAGFLERVLAATGAEAGAVWARGPEGDYRLRSQLNLEAVGLEKAPEGKAGHAAALRLADRRGQPLWLAPHTPPATADGEPAANATDHELFLAPVLVDGQAAGLVEIWRRGGADLRSARKLAHFLGEASGFVAAYLHRGQWEQLRGQEKLWERLQAYSRRVHSSLDPAEVAVLAANEARRLVGCDQLAVATGRRAGAEVEAISGAAFVERRGPLYRALTALCHAVREAGDPLVYAGAKQEGLPPAVVTALDGYLAHSPSRLLVALPLRDARQKQGDKPCVVLVAECFRPDVAADQVRGRMEALAIDTASALYNAREYHRGSFGGLARWLVRVRDGLEGRYLAWAGLGFSAVLAAAAVLALVHIPLRLEARGELLPRDRQTVYSPLNGKVVEVKVRQGEPVGKGQELVLMEDADLQLQIEQLGLKAGSAEERLAALRQQLGRATANEERNTLTREIIDQEYEMRKAAAERDVLLQGSRSPRKAPVVAPLTGKVLTFDPSDQLLGKTAKPGDPLLRVARVQGPWEVELYLPEGRVGEIREGLGRSPDGALEVAFLLESQPHRTYRGRLTRDGLGGEATVRETAVVLPARVEITDRDLLTQLEAMPVGVEVRARVNCGRRALGYVWFADLWEFVYEHLLF